MTGGALLYTRDLPGGGYVAIEDSSTPASSPSGAPTSRAAPATPRR